MVYTDSDTGNNDRVCRSGGNLGVTICPRSGENVGCDLYHVGYLVGGIDVLLYERIIRIPFFLT